MNLFHYRPQTKLREGNVLTPVCDSVHSGVSVQGRGLCPGGSLSREGLCPGGSLSREGVCPGRVSVREGLRRGGVVCQGDPPCGKERAVRILLGCILV